MAWLSDRPVGLQRCDAERSEAGYTLFAKQDAFLLDPEGRVVHRWADVGGSRCELLPNGNLLANRAAPDDAGGAETIGGSSRGLVELDWDGNEVWRYDDDLLHHEFTRLDDGRTLALGWERLRPELAERVRGGVPDPEGMPMTWSDVVHVISPVGDLEDCWHAQDHLDPDVDVLCPLDARKEWTHANSIATMPDGRWLISFRLTSTVVIVDPATGDIAWRWGDGQTSHQHDATPLGDDRIMLFDNGCHRAGLPTFSRVIEVDVETGEIGWTHRGVPVLSLYSYMGSGAERLPGGNTLITECATGRFLEVTPDHDVVWEYVSPFTTLDPRFGPSTASGNAHRYPLDDPRFEGRDLDPGAHPVNARLAAGEKLPLDDLG